MDKNKHVIVISEDALVREDLDTLRRLPAFGEVLQKGALIKTVRSVYPTITYPCHTTMRTGVACGRHGIVNNERADDLTRLRAPWEWFHDAVRVGDIFDAAHAAGLTTASVFWPATGNHPHVDYLIDEYWPQYPGQTAEQCFAASGSGAEVMEKVIRPNRHLLNWKQVHPACDAFVHACACSIIRQFRPNLLLLHPANIDEYRHESGVFSPLVTRGLHEIDGWLGDVLKALDDAGIRDQTDLFIVSDHGQMNITRTVALNALLAERGLLTVDADGNIADYTAVARSAAMSAQVYVRDPADTARVYAVLREMAEDGLYGFERVYTAEEARREEGLYGGFSFVLESDGYTSFSNACTRPLVRPADNSDYKCSRATHGYHPDKGPQPVLLACGPHIRPGAVLERRSILDEAPTYARILGVELPDAEGTAIEEILRPV